MKISKRRIFGIIALIILFVLFWMFFIQKPSNDKAWEEDQAILPSAEREENLVKLHNIRDFSYTSTTEFTPHYYDETFDIDKIKAVSFVVVPFSPKDGPGGAHTFLSFEFEEEKFVAISIEIRKELHEAFSPWKGLFNQYEIMYVAASERDVIRLRTNFRQDKVYLYPAVTEKEKMQALFVDMVDRINKLHEEPEFYNTFTNTCTTNIVSHINTIAPDRIPFDFRILLPKNSDRFAQELGLIESGASLEELRSQSLITQTAQSCPDSEDFSLCIREREY